MKISAHIRNRSNEHELTVATAGRPQRLAVSAKASGNGSAINGGELLMAALATCYCNDLYREAERLGVGIAGCEVVATAQFGGVGLAAGSITYSARIESSASAVEVEHLLSETDRLAEVHNTLRAGCAVRRVAWHEFAV
ncbi:MAG TPA: OsmC family protein [Frateuria sp.]|uniref:OsmC family protein n=1 Tax=Frateuria sp. TaxID=2211372 RepID=UPI002DE9372A|nr:OsmC family protein [Frateuria sp.]